MLVSHDEFRFSKLSLACQRYHQVIVINDIHNDRKAIHVNRRDWLVG